MFKGTVKEKWADLKKSSRFTGLVLALLGAIKLQNDLGKPRVEALHGSLMSWDSSLPACCWGSASLA